MKQNKTEIRKLQDAVDSCIASGDHVGTLECGVALLNAETLQADVERDIKQAVEQAESMGKSAGENAALWVIQDTWGGRVTRGEREAAQSFLDAYEDCELDALPNPPNLSGEWADSETPATLMESCFGEDWQDNEDFRDAQDDICSAWEQAASDAFFSTLVDSAQNLVS